MIYREPGYLASRMVWVLTRPLSPSLDRRHTASWEGVTTCWWQRGVGGWGRSQIIQKSCDIKEAWSSIHFSILPMHGSPRDKVMTSVLCLHCKKELAVFPSPAGMSLIKLFLGGNNLVFSRPERVWSVTSRLGTGKWLTLFYSVVVNAILVSFTSLQYILIQICSVYRPGCTV